MSLIVSVEAEQMVEEGFLDLGLPETPPLPLPICPPFIPALAGGGSRAGVILD